MSEDFENRLAQKYSLLTEQQRRASAFIAQNPLDCASRSLRSIASESQIAPATYSRLARALGYEGFDALRDSLRQKLDRQMRSFAERAADIGPGSGFADRHIKACQDNIAALSSTISPQSLDRAAEALARAPRVFLFGALGARGVVEYLSYLAHFCAEDWRLMGARGSSMGGALADLRPGDAVVLVTKAPFSPRGDQALALAHERGAHIVVITDSYACPALRHGDSCFIVPSESPHFYSSYVATLALIEILIGLIVSKAGHETRARIAQVEQSNRRLGEIADG